MIRITVVTAFFILIAGGTQAAHMYQDLEFNMLDWTEHVVLTLNGATSNVEQRPSGGDTGSYRHMTHTMPGSGAKIWVIHLNSAATYDPSSQGRILSISYFESHRLFDPPFPGATIGARFALYQSGKYFVTGNLDFDSQTWESRSLLNRDAADFVEVLGGTIHTNSHPDFSYFGGEITFGYSRFDSTTAGSATTEHGIDNWTVTVQSRSPIPTMSAWGLLILGVVFIMIGTILMKRRVAA